MKWTVKQEECVGCGACVNACPYDNFVVENGKAHLKEQIDCCGCYACFHHCPKRAIVDPKGKLDKKAQYKFEKYYIGNTNKIMTIEELKRDQIELQ